MADPTTWVAHVGAIFAFAVLLNFRNLSWCLRALSAVYALVVVGANWLIGGGWAVYASCLEKPHVCQQLGLIP